MKNSSRYRGSTYAEIATSGEEFCADSKITFDFALVGRHLGFLIAKKVFMFAIIWLLSTKSNITRKNSHAGTSSPSGATGY